MNGAGILSCAVVGLVFGAVMVLTLRSLIMQQDIRRRFSREECRGEDLAKVISALAHINAGSQDCTFGLERAFRVSFRGEQLLLVLGHVGRTVPSSKYGTSRASSNSLYALADGPAQVGWMRENSDVFSPACPDPAFPIFWVDYSALKSQLDPVRYQ